MTMFWRSFSQVPFLSAIGGVLCSSPTSTAQSNDSSVFYVNSTTLPTTVRTSLNVNASGSVDTLYPGTNISSQISAIFSSALNQTASPGGALLVHTPGNGTYFQSFGYDKYNGTVPFALDNHIRIASNTKTFTGSAVLKLASEGRLSLNDTWSKYYNGSQGAFPYAENITVEQMLTMSSGVFDYVTSTEYLDGPNSDPTIALSYNEAISIIAKNQPYFAPGQTQYFNYSNSNFLMLGHIIEVASGVPDYTYIQDNFIQPLNLTNTLWPQNLTLPDPHPRGYAYYPSNATTGIRDATIYNPLNPGAAGAMVSTLQDMRSWVESMIRGYGLSDELAQRRLNGNMLPLEGLPAGITLTYGLAVLTLNGFHGHDGGIKGFSTMMMTHPEKNITVCWVGSQGADNGPGGVSLPTAVGIFALLNPEGS